MKSSRLADLSLLFVAMMWGCTFLIVQNAVKVLPPLAFNGFRFIGASLLLALIISIFYRDQWRQMSRKMWLHGALLGIFLFLGYGLQTMGLLYTTTSNAGFITGLSVVLVPMIAATLLRHKLSRYTWFSVLLAAAGLYMLTFSGGIMKWNYGDMLILLCAVAFALQIAFTGIYAPHYPALALSVIQLAVVGVLSTIFSFFIEDVGPLSQTLDLLVQPDVLIALLISIGPTSAFAFWIQTACQQYTTPSRVAVIFTMEPVFAAFTGVFFAGEKIGTLALFGCLLILIGMITAELKSANNTAVQENKIEINSRREPNV
ncbi:DMT family transporter [Paenibacillus sediminis]|uniref:Drug/metabolite transporter (DMT)-like permease n=1 Tax=Paenibacillus sediminis TaxID=664909 RepID=A0ABS4H4J3_9BACL|nr:DMT family transporter [Paenibacillus sediminis]MBP1937454.1 drug/metabolite transporter (DMT)-like permease [Paenibacillus sediminis]